MASPRIFVVLTAYDFELCSKIDIDKTSTVVHVYTSHSVYKPHELLSPDDMMHQQPHVSVSLVANSQSVSLHVPSVTIYTCISPPHFTPPRNGSLLDRLQTHIICRRKTDAKPLQHSCSPAVVGADQAEPLRRRLYRRVEARPRHISLSI